MAFEKEIKQAQKVADVWLKKSKDAEEFFIALKKSGIKWEKDNIKTIENSIERKETNEALEMIKDSRKWIDDYEQQAEKVFDQHAKFVRGAPRAGSKGICEEIGLKPKDDAYKPVNDAMAKALLVHTKQFKATEAAWTADLKPRIDLLRSKLDTLEKLAKGEEGKIDAYVKQFTKDTTAYKDQMEKAVTSLKPTMGELAIKNITQNPATWCSGVAKVQIDQYTIFKDRVALVDKLLQLSEKNYNRVLKSVPEDVKSKLMFQRLLKTFQTAHLKVISELKSAQGIFKTAVAVFEKNYPDLV
jgi:hypothetical protein